MSRTIAALVVAALVAGRAVGAEPKSEVDVLIRSAAKAESEGNLDEAWATYDRALELARSRGEPAAEAKVLRHRGITALHQMDTEQGARDLVESVRLFDASGEPIEAATSRLHLVAALDGLGRTEQADDEMRIAERALASSGDEATRHFADVVQGRRLITRGRHKEALPRLEKAVAYFERVGKQGRLSDALSLEAYALQQLGAWEASKKSYRALLDVAFRTGNQGQVAYVYCNLGEVEQHLGSPQIAGELLDQSIDLLDRMRARIPGGPQDRVAFLDTQVDAYHRKIALLVDSKRAAEALAVAERFHSRAFLEAIGERPDRAPAPSPAFETSSRALLALQRKLLRSGLTEDEKRTLRAEEARWTSLAKESRRGRTETAISLQPVNIEELRRRIPPRTAFLRYWVHPRRTLLWVVRASGVELIQIPILDDDLDSAVKRYLEPIRDRTLAQDVALRGGAGDHLKAGAELHRLLVAPARSLLEGVDVLVVVPDATLWYVPFEALVVKHPEPMPEVPAKAPLNWEYSQARYLADDYRVLYAPSISAWARLLDVGKEGRGFVSFAPFSDGASSTGRGIPPPLPTARDESAAIASRFTTGEVFLGADASEPNAKQVLARARYVHFAAHGYLHRERPDLSGIYLWSAETPVGNTSSGDDGLLQAHEIEGLQLRSELVSLAVCNSALGQFSRGEGLLGLGRVFLTSGARNVVVSLWPAHDSASTLLMRRFYEEVARGRSLSGALQTAKRELRTEVRTGTIVLGDEKVSYAHPYYWAGFVQIGADGRSP